MRVAFPTNNQKTIANHIGLAKGFLIIDTNTGEKFYIENPVLKKINEENINLKDLPEGQRGLGTGRVIPPLLAEAGVDMLIARDFGEGMLRNLAYEGIEAIETDEKEIDAVLTQLNENINLKRPTINENEFYGYGRRMGFGYGRGFGRGLGRGRGLGFGRRMGYGRGFGRRWFD
jgi:predicted Fe-Mo cluster-binding NifX family protein